MFNSRSVDERRTIFKRRDTKKQYNSVLRYIKLRGNVNVQTRHSHYESRNTSFEEYPINEEWQPREVGYYRGVVES